MTERESSESKERPVAAPTAERPPTLLDRLPASGKRLPPDGILDRFLDYVAALGLQPYPAQETAILELLAGRHVILSTPTGSGKSLVAQGLHFQALCEDEWSFYTSPTKALASEKFFELCRVFGPQNVGMLTGDASVNRDAPLICCTAEILSNMILREGAQAAPPYVVMDEFHYYAEPQRGVAWQVPLVSCPQTTFLLMSATLGDMRQIAERLEADTKRPVAHVTSDDRPVPLDYEYRETPIQETVVDLVEGGKAPIYIVSFTHDDCAELAQALTSVDVCGAETKSALARELEDVRFGTPYGRELRRFLRFGIAVHHAGLLPKYRLLVEQLAQQGLLRIVCGTDTLGVGVNIPIRTVLFAKLAKYDGEKVRILTARDFKQISGRAGRKGFDDRGSVVCQAPEHVIERKRAQRRARVTGKKKHRKKKPPPRGFVGWDRNTFESLVGRPPEPLVSQFCVTHGMILNLLQRDPDETDDEHGYRAVVALVLRSHEDETATLRLLREAAQLFRSLRRAELVELERDERSGANAVRLSGELQEEFSLHETLSLYLVDAVLSLDPTDPQHGLNVLSLVESILEDPRKILIQQERKLKSELVARLKAERVPYEERMRQLEEVTHPKPLADFIYATFDAFARHHPWVQYEDIRPKSIAREMLEGYTDFHGYVRRYGLQRSEGLLLRYLSQTYKTLIQTVPEAARSDGVYDAIAFLRALLERVDTSLVEEWERLMGLERHEEDERPAAAEAEYDLASDEKALAARVRVEMRHFVRALADEDYDEAARWIRQDAEDPWDGARIEQALIPFFEEHDAIVFEPRLWKRRHTLLRQTDLRVWEVAQVLLDSSGFHLWHLAGEVDLRGATNPREPLVRPYDIRM